ncbi:fungal-specific transcription factor domain-containing protein [Scheffersomyces amazonensis]|uniref:fungal-specific transcription factor domain-containing protein n=1 Tax=Scheffersomyces amazonensis TaxID=1078765 RepID=UPI00315CABE9
MTLVDKIYSTYSSEFYLVDIVELRDILDRAYTVLAHQPYDPAVSICQLSLCYLFIIFAFGEQLLATHIVSTSIKDFPGMQYYLLAEHLFPLTREGVDFKFIQSALLLGFYAANLNRYSTVYNYLGVAARSAVALGYHRQPLNKKSDLIFYEKAKQLWWSVFVIDTTWATKTVHFQFTDTDVDLPTENMSPLVGNHNFDNNILEVNVHLTKYVAKFVRLIYGPNMRTFSINYINTSQFNQKLLLKNIVASSQDLIRNFEDSFLNPQFATTTIINPTTGSRNLANLFLRYHQLIILITKPLLSLMVDPSSYLTTSPIIDKENLKDVEATMARGILTSCATVDIISHLFVNEKVFILGFWDSQHLFSALILLISISCIGHQPHRSAHQVQFRQVDQGIALLKFMAERGNINAASCMDKLVEINRLLVTTPEVQYSLNLDVDVKKVLDIPKPHDNLYNPLKSSPLNKTFQSIGELGSLETYLPRSESSPYMETALFKVVHEIQSWNS